MLDLFGFMFHPRSTFVFIRDSGQGVLERPFLICCVRLTHMEMEIKDGAPVNWEWLEEGRVGRQTAFQSKKSQEIFVFGGKGTPELESSLAWGLASAI